MLKHARGFKFRLAFRPCCNDWTGVSLCQLSTRPTTCREKLVLDTTIQPISAELLQRRLRAQTVRAPQPC